MVINKNTANGIMEFSIEGKLDTTTAPQLEAELNALPGDITAVVFDFQKLIYISSAGLRVLLKFYKKMNTLDGMKVIHVNESIMEVLDMTGFTDFLTVE